MDHKQILANFKGIFPPVVTPFNRGGDVDEGRFRENLRKYAGVGLGGIVVTGSTGEAPYLTERERLRLVELAREIVRKFNNRWGEYFPEPQAILSSTPKILGLDGQAKMSKSLGNTIALGEDNESIRQKLATAATDPARIRRKDLGNPDVCNIHTLHSFFSDAERIQWVRSGCSTAAIGCIDCKGVLADNIIAHLQPIRERRTQLKVHPERVEAILREGARKARAVAQQTVVEVRKRIGLWP